MQLLLFRHGEAEKGGAGGSDAARRLVPKGRAENEACLLAVRRAGVQPEVVVHSPLVRAVETAAMAGEILAPPGGLHEDERLACGASLADVRAVVAEHPGETVMLVGHNPDFSEITGELIGGGNVALRTSGIACVSLPLVAAGAGVLEWLIKPRLFGDR